MPRDNVSTLAALYKDLFASVAGVFPDLLTIGFFLAPHIVSG
jgi:hypothetical protein